MKPKKKRAIGIDLGTTVSCVGLWESGKIVIIPNQQGKYITPSIVSFLGDRRFVGEEAKVRIIKNNQNTIYSSKRLIGKKYDDPNVKKDIKKLPFEVEKDKTLGRCLVKINYENEEKIFKIEQISGMIIEQMKKIAETYLNDTVEDAIITVPAYFNQVQRQCTIDAAKIAGLNVLRIINEPTAAAITYGLENGYDKDRKVLIFDLGGGTFDVTVLNIKRNITENEENDNYIDIKSTYGDSHLGGQDFDDSLVDFCLKEFEYVNGIDLSKNSRALQRLKIACERAKIELSLMDETEINIDGIQGNINMKIRITRDTFNDCCKQHFDKLLPCVKKALELANYNKKDIDDVVLVGGSIRIQEVQNIVKNFFGISELKTYKCHPDEAIAYGAAYQAAIINGDILNDKLLLFDIVGISLGIEIANGKMEFIIKRGTKIPIHKKKIFTTNRDNQTKLNFNIYQGENENCKNNVFLNEINLDNITKAPAGKIHIEVVFYVDVNSTLTITAGEVGTSKSNKIVIENLFSNYNKKELEKMIKEAEKMRIKDKENEAIIKYKNKLKEKCLEKKTSKAKEILKWIKENEKNDNFFEKKELEKKFQELN
jgi:L1 cell adhesion molecule like protein